MSKDPTIRRVRSRRWIALGTVAAAGISAAGADPARAAGGEGVSQSFGSPEATAPASACHTT